jgi:hypothetical protein
MILQENALRAAMICTRQCAPGMKPSARKRDRGRGHRRVAAAACLQAAQQRAQPLVIAIVSRTRAAGCGVVNTAKDRNIADRAVSCASVGAPARKDRRKR